MRWLGIFTNKTFRKHLKLIFPHRDLIVCIVSLAFFNRILPSAFFHPHFIIRIFPSAFYHPHFIIHHPPSAIRHPPSAIRHPHFTETLLQVAEIKLSKLLLFVRSVNGKKETTFMPLPICSDSRFRLNCPLAQICKLGNIVTFLYLPLL